MAVKKGPEPKTNEDFYDESLEFFLSNGETLKPVSDVTDVYNDHSVIKLIAMTYWVGIFVPIIRKKLVDQFGYRMAYVDTMGGSGVTATARMGDCFVGSCPAAVIAANRRGHPFDIVTAVEVDKGKARALELRLRIHREQTETRVLDQPLEQVSQQIHDSLSSKTTTYAFVDPEGFEGMTWGGLHPILELKGDAMITWFEADAYRWKAAADAGGASADGNARRLDDLLGAGAWKNARSGQELTDLFCRRVEATSGKLAGRQFEVSDREKRRYKLLLFAGAGCPQQLPDHWLKQMRRRFVPGLDIATLVDRKKGRAPGLDSFMEPQTKSGEAGP